MQKLIPWIARQSATGEGWFVQDINGKPIWSDGTPSICSQRDAELIACAVNDYLMKISYQPKMNPISSKTGIKICIQCRYVFCEGCEIKNGSNTDFCSRKCLDEYNNVTNRAQKTLEE